MKKKILLVAMCCLMLVGVVGCDKKSKKHTVSNNPSTFGKLTESRNFGKDLKLFKEFYAEFYNEHSDYDSEYDCFGKVVISNNTLFMTIMDVAKDGSKADLYLFENAGKEVITKAKLKITEPIYDIYAISIQILEDKIYIVTRTDGKGYEAYKLVGESFEALDSLYIESENTEYFKTGVGKNGIGANYFLMGDLFYQDDIFSDEYEEICLENVGTNFEEMLDKISEKSINNNIELQIHYAEYLYEKGYIEYNEEVCAVYWENGISYCIYADGKARVMAMDNGYDDIPKSVQGYNVDFAELDKSYLSKDKNAADNVYNVLQDAIADPDIYSDWSSAIKPIQGGKGIEYSLADFCVGKASIPLMQAALVDYLKQKNFTDVLNMKFHSENYKSGTYGSEIKIVMDSRENIALKVENGSNVFYIPDKDTYNEIMTEHKMDSNQ